MVSSLFKRFSLFLLTIVSVLLSVSSGHALTIDYFNDNMRAETTPSNPSVTVAAASSSAIGGFRTLSATKIAGDLGFRLETLGGSLNHSQDNGVKGNSKITWDGDDNGFSFNPAGLGGIDFTRDGATAFVLENVYFDFAGGNSLEIIINVFDTTTGTSASKSYTLNGYLDNETITIPFSGFLRSGTSEPISLKSVGALSIDILGLSSSFDLSFGLFKTNGSCSVVPNGKVPPIDDCGVCGGTNADKDQCGVCFGGNRDMDSCGVCFGMNRDLDDCGVCGGNNAGKDLCGICGGDNSSCKDCAGTPNGTATLDVCNICGGNGKSCIDCTGLPFGQAKVDACGVCDGDGRSCIKCEALDVSATLQKMLDKSAEQRANAIFFIKKVQQSDKKFAKTVRSQIDALYDSLVKRIAAIPAKVNQCDPSPLCVTTSNVGTIESYKSDVQKLQEVSLKILTHKVPEGPGVCKGDLKGCIKRQKDQVVNRHTLISYVKLLAQENRKLSELVPLTASVCSE